MYSWMRRQMAAERAWLREQAELVTEAQPLGLGAILRQQQARPATPEQLQRLQELAHPLVTVKELPWQQERRPSRSRKSTKSRKKTARSTSKPHR